MSYQSTYIALVFRRWDVFCNFVEPPSCKQQKFISGQYCIKKSLEFAVQISEARQAVCSVSHFFRHSAWTHSTPWTHSMDMQHGHAAGTCSRDMQKGHAADPLVMALHPYILAPISEGLQCV
jgi:hypothetical protein